MSQIYRNMNKIGKVYFYIGSLMTLTGTVVLVFREINVGAGAMAMGLYFMSVAQFDNRCNIKNDSKGNPIEAKNDVNT